MFRHRGQIRFGEYQHVPSSYKSAIVIIPPRHCWEQIQDFRKKYDKAYHRWMPHINLIYPYLDENDGQKVFHQESLKLCKQLASVKPFKTTLTKESIGQFYHGRTVTVWVKPIRPYDDQGGNLQTQTTPVPVINKPKKTKIITKKVKKETPKNIPPRVYTETVVIWTGYTPPLSGPMKNYESSLDNLSNAQWRVGQSDRQPLKNILGHGPGLDCLQYAEWTPENTKKPMFTKAVHKNETVVLDQKKVQERKQYVEEYKEIKVEVTDSEESESEDNSDIDDSIVDSTAADPRVINLQAKLQAMYPNLNEQSTKSPDGFQPHLTLGQDTPADSNLLSLVNQTWENIEFEVNEVYIISRDDKNPFTIKKAIPLGAL